MTGSTNVPHSAEALERRIRQRAARAIARTQRSRPTAGSVTSTTVVNAATAVNTGQPGGVEHVSSTQTVDIHQAV